MKEPIDFTKIPPDQLQFRGFPEPKILGVFSDGFRLKVVYKGGGSIHMADRNFDGRCWSGEGIEVYSDLILKPRPPLKVTGHTFSYRTNYGDVGIDSFMIEKLDPYWTLLLGGLVGFVTASVVFIFGN